MLVNLHLGTMTATRPASPRPKIVLQAGQHHLQIPVPMQQVLAQVYPGFQVWQEGDYLPAIQAQYPYSWQSAPFAVVGDFNGDGRWDLALDGHSQKYSLLIALVSYAGSYQVLVLDKGPLIDPRKLTYPVGAETQHGMMAYLQYQAPGTYTSQYEARPLRLETDALQEIYLEKAAILRFLKGNVFFTYYLAD